MQAFLFLVSEIFRNFDFHSKILGYFGMKTRISKYIYIDRKLKWNKKSVNKNVSIYNQNKKKIIFREIEIQKLAKKKKKKKCLQLPKYQKFEKMLWLKTS